MSPEPLDVPDRLAIDGLYARYSHCFDGNRPDEWAALFTADGRFVRPGYDDVVGTEALAAMVRDTHDQRPHVSHHVSNVLVERTEEGARGTAYALVLRTVPGEPLRLRNVGRYEDVIVRQGGAWRFRVRRFESWLAPDQLDGAFVFV